MDVLFGGTITEVSTCKTEAEVKTGVATLTEWLTQTRGLHPRSHSFRLATRQRPVLRMFTSEFTQAQATRHCTVSSTIESSEFLFHSWSVFHEALEKSKPRPSTQVLLLTDILRALWDHDAEDDDDLKLCIHLPDQSLVRSLRSPRRLTPMRKKNGCMSSSVYLCVHLPPKVCSPSLTSPDMGMFIAREFACTGITASQFQPGKDCVPSLCTQYFETLPLSDYIPTSFPHDTWTWRDLFHEAPTLLTGSAHPVPSAASSPTLQRSKPSSSIRSSYM